MSDINTQTSTEDTQEQIAALQTQVTNLQNALREVDQKYQVQVQYIVAVVSNTLGITFPPLHAMYNTGGPRELGTGAPLNPTGSEFL